MGALFGLSLRQMIGKRRMIIIVLLAALPVALAVLLDMFARGDGDFNENFISTIVDALIVAVVLPLVVMTQATAAFGNELEDRTLNVLVLKPVSRLSIVVPKLLGSIIVTGPVLVAAGVAVTAIALGGGGARALLATAAALSTGVIVYAAVFTWAGLISSRSLGFALVYVFLWEGLVTSFLSGARYLSVRGYTLGILHGLDEETFTPLAGRVIELPAAIVGAALVTIVFFVLTVRRLQRMDVQ